MHRDGQGAQVCTTRGPAAIASARGRCAAPLLAWSSPQTDPGPSFQPRLQVSYKRSAASTLGLHIPLDLVAAAKAAQASADREVKRPRTDGGEQGTGDAADAGPGRSAAEPGLAEPPRVGLAALLNAFFDEAEVEGVWSAAAAKNTTVRRLGLGMRMGRSACILGTCFRPWGEGGGTHALVPVPAQRAVLPWARVERNSP